MRAVWASRCQHMRSKLTCNSPPHMGVPSGTCATAAAAVIETGSNCLQYALLESLLPGSCTPSTRHSAACPTWTL